MRDGGYLKFESLLEFTDHFRTEEDCRQYLFSRRWPEGFVCPRCGESAATHLVGPGLEHHSTIVKRGF